MAQITCIDSEEIIHLHNCIERLEKRVMELEQKEKTVESIESAVIPSTLSSHYLCFPSHNIAYILAAENIHHAENKVKKELGIFLKGNFFITNNRPKGEYKIIYVLAKMKKFLESLT